MMRFRLIVLFSVMSYVNSFGQELLPQSYDTLVHKQSVHITGLGFYQTSHLRNELSSIFLSGGYLTDEIKQNSRLDENQAGRIGGDVSTEMVFKSAGPLQAKKEMLGWMAKIGYSNTFGAQYSKDAFDLLFFGNQLLLGQEAVIANTSAFNLGFYKAGFGIYDRSTKNSVVLNLVLGNSYTGFDIDRGNLAFNEDGSEVTANLDLGVERANSPAFFQGIGASVDFELHAKIKDVPGISGYFQLTGKNLGVLYMPKVDVFELTTDTSFEGFTINELSNLAQYSSADFDAFVDSLGFSSSTSSALRLIPGGSIQAGKIVESSSDKRVQSFFGVRVLTNIIYRPMAFGGAHVRVNDWLGMGAQLTFGGYGGFRGGLYAQTELKNIQVGIGSEDVVGFFAQSTFGKSVLIRGIWRIN